MTVASTTDRDTFTGNGSQTVFAFTFRVIESDHVKVYLNSVLQASGYTVALNSSGVGGSVTFGAAPANGAAVLVLRESDYLQEDTLSVGQNEALPPKTIERMVDKVTILAQQIKKLFDRSVRLADTVDPATISTVLPGWTSGYVLRFNTDSGDKKVESVSPLQAWLDLAPSTGSGNLLGPNPAVSTNNAVAIWDGTSGRLQKNGPVPATDNYVLKVQSGQWVAGPVPGSTPSGSVVFFCDATHVPAGYAIMDGQTVTVNGAPFVTPDCRGKYLMVAAVSDSGSSGYTGAEVRPGQINGALTHAHGLSGTVATDSQNPGSNVVIGQGGVGATGVKTDASLAHTHNVTLSGNTAQSAALDRPKYVALIAAIKVD